MFTAKLERLRALHDFVDRFCRDTGIGADSALRLNVLLEELFTNTVRHGHRGDSDAPIWVTLCAGPDAVQITYEDRAPPFNPYGATPDATPDTTLRSRRLGGLGVLLTRRLAASREYAYLYGRNRIRLACTLD